MCVCRGNESAWPSTAASAMRHRFAAESRWSRACRTITTGGARLCLLLCGRGQPADVLLVGWQLLQLGQLRP